MMRPSAVILRCRNLQLLGDSAKLCPITIRSENYTVEHFVADCSNPTLCVNYHLNNHRKITDNSISHRSSDLNCPFYKKAI